VLLRHATLIRNLPNIERHGLLCSKSKGKRKAIWLHHPAHSEWAVLHTVRRHGGRVEKVIVLEVEIDPATYRSWGPGLGWVCQDLPWRAVRRVIEFEELSASPVER